MVAILVKSARADIMIKLGNRIGIALGSGGARGLAHVGVLEVLLENGIRPAFVAGTSMGAIIGAAYASGNFAKLVDVLRSLDIAETATLFMDFGFGKPGIVKGRRVMDFLATILPDVTFSELKTPFAAMATDIETGEAVMMTRGRILTAIRASISIPGIFTPARRGSATLLDGGISSPVPIDAARALGAGSVIAVNVDGGAPCPYCTHRLPKVVNRAISFHERLHVKIREGLGIAGDGKTGFFETLSKTTRICENRIARWEVERARPEWLVEPAVGDIPTMDFSRIDDAIGAGRDAAKAFLETASIAGSTTLAADGNTR